MAISNAMSLLIGKMIARSLEARVSYLLHFGVWVKMGEMVTTHKRPAKMLALGIRRLPTSPRK